MQPQIVMDKLSECVMVEQGGLQLYRVAASRSRQPKLRAKYEEFERQTAHHREVLVQLIQRLGGEPSYVSPTARLAQVKAMSLLEAALVVDGLSQQEIEANDLENLLLAETKDHADWHLLTILADQVDDQETKQALQEVVETVEAQEDQHLGWARDTLAQLALQMVTTGPAPDPDRAVLVTSGPQPPIAEIHPAPLDGDLLLEAATRPMWIAAPAVRALAAGTS
jgi:rubrerythrin